MSDTVTGAVHTAEILPCPFCKSVNVYVRAPYGGGLAMVRCRDCSAHGPIRPAGAAAVTDWNAYCHAVSAAEGDLLGKALEALRAWEKLHDGMIAEGGDVSALPADRLVHFAKVQAVALNETRAILSQAQARELTR